MNSVRASKGFVTPNLACLGAGLVAVALLLAWGFFERAGKLTAQKRVITLSAQVVALSAAVKECNDSISRHKADAAKAEKRAQDAMADAKKDAAKFDKERAQWRRILAAPPPTKDGKPLGCAEAWGEIERRVRR